MQHADLAAVADAVVARPYLNPRPVTREAVLEILEAAWQGRVLSAVPVRAGAADADPRVAMTPEAQTTDPVISTRSSP